MLLIRLTTGWDSSQRIVQRYGIVKRILCTTFPASTRRNWREAQPQPTPEEFGGHGKRLPLGKPFRAELSISTCNRVRTHLVSRFEIEVACSMPSLSKVPRQIKRSSSLTWLASILFTVLLWCSGLLHWVELSYWTVLSTLVSLFRTTRVDLSLLLLVTIPSTRSCFTSFPSAGFEPSCANTGVESPNTSTDANNNANNFLTMLTSSLTIHSKDCDVWHDTINLATEKSQPIRGTAEQHERGRG